MIRESVPGRYCDSRLYTRRVSGHRNADLIITIRAYLDRHDPPGVYGTVTDVGDNTVQIMQWGSSWQPWTQSLRQVVERGFRNRLWLVPSAPWGIEWPRTGSPTHVPNVKCGLRFEIATAASGAHVNIRCVRLAPMASHTSSMSRQTRRGWLDNRDIESVNKTPPNSGETHPQIPALHEIGHLLGLAHVHCLRNDTVCYGTTPHQRGDLMGWGSRVERWHAWPWLARLPQHLDGSVRASWTATARRPQPQQYDALAARPLPGGVGTLDAGVR